MIGMSVSVAVVSVAFVGVAFVGVALVDAALVDVVTVPVDILLSHFLIQQQEVSPFKELSENEFVLTHSAGTPSCLYTERN